MVEIEKFLTISTAHIEQSTANWLDKQAAITKSPQVAELVTYSKGEYGWFVYVGDFLEENLDTVAIIPRELHFLAGYASAKDCCWLQIDRDVDPSESLPKFEW